MYNRQNLDVHAPTKAWLWIYFLLLVWEGALRKWIAPGMSDIFFLIRDPVVMIIYFSAFRTGAFPRTPAIASIVVMAGLALIFSIPSGNRLAVTLFGLRTDFLHLPLIFVMTNVLDRRDVIQYGRWTLVFSIPILYLMYHQFNADPDSALNVGAGGSVGGQIRGAMGKIRPAGPFSFISGVVDFFSLAAAYVFYGWMQPRTFGRIFLLAGTAAVIVAVPISISRSLLLGVLIVAAFGLGVIIKDPKRIPNFVGPLIAAAAFVVFAADTIYVQAFATRWSEANAGANGDVYGNTVVRMVDQFLEPISIAADTPLLGNGIGLGTMAGARLNTGNYNFLLSESELSRCVLELGPLLGFAFIGWRVWMTIKMVVEGWRGFLNDADPLAWLIAGSTFLTFLCGQWGPATNLGFSIFGAGLTFAALKSEDEELLVVESEERDEPIGAATEEA